MDGFHAQASAVGTWWETRMHRDSRRDLRPKTILYGKFFDGRVSFVRKDFRWTGFDTKDFRWTRRDLVGDADAQGLATRSQAEDVHPSHFYLYEKLLDGRFSMACSGVRGRDRF